MGNRLFVGASTPDEALAVFNELFAIVFLHFDSFYSSAIADYLRSGGKPEFTIMQFNPIRERFFTELVAQLHGGVFGITLVEQAHERRQARAAAPARAPPSAPAASLVDLG